MQTSGPAAGKGHSPRPSSPGCPLITRVFSGIFLTGCFELLIFPITL